MGKANKGRSTRWPSPTFVILAILLSPIPSRSTDWNPLTDTGQEKCYDTNGAEISCPAAGKAYYGQDAHSLGKAAAYTDNGNQTITDRNTGLTWVEFDEGIQRTWEDALSYCNELSFAGHNNWRLPSKFELESIVDYGQFYPAIKQPFSCQRSFYWSSTPHAANPVYAWSVYCLDGADHWVHRSNNYYVRCVRDGI